MLAIIRDGLPDELAPGRAKREQMLLAGVFLRIGESGKSRTI